MDAQIIVVFQNGYAEARDPKLRNRFELLNIPDKKEIKKVIWHNLLRVGRAGHVVVKWADKLFVCEMKEDKKGYTRTEVEYHPYGDQFEI